jgi:hypothetical protein
LSEVVERIGKALRLEAEGRAADDGSVTLGRAAA